MKVLVADKIAGEGVAYLRDQGDLEVVEAYGSTPEEVVAHAADANAIIVRGETQVTAEVVAAAGQLKVVGRAGVGIDNIDLDAATGAGVIVMNTPGGNTVATAELTFTHMLCTARPITEACATMRSGGWDRHAYKGSELLKKTLGVLGMGRIGTEVARRAQAFGMTVIAYDPYLTGERAGVLEVRKVELEDLFAEADYITVHMPKTEATTDMINAAAFARMKDGVRIINCARGGIVNQDDLLAAVESGKVAGAGLDVYEEEPLAADHPLRTTPGMVLTPHLGASTEEAQVSVGVEIARNVAAVLRGEPAVNAINMPSVDPRSLKLLRPYLALGEALGTILQQISPEAVEKICITYWGKIAELDTLPLTRSIQRGYLRRISGENVNDVNAPHLLKNLGVAVDSTTSSTDADYADLVRVEAHAGGGVTSIEGTVLGTSHRPRVVHINGRDVEANPEGFLLVFENIDQPGMVGQLGSILGRDNVNIANMSLSRNALGDKALTVIQVDSAPGAAVLEEIVSNPAISSLHLVEVQ